MEGKEFTNEKIAELMAQQLYGPSLTETDFAFQLFVERTVCPKGCDSYTDTDMKKWILDKLNNI